MPTKIPVRLLVPICAFIALVLVFGGVMAFRARQQASGQPNAAKPSLPSNSTATPVSASAQTQSSAPRVAGSDAMSEAFRKAKLPSPLSNPDGDPDHAAAELARRVVASDDQSTAALLTAIRMSGISVRGDDGSLAIESVKQGQGIYFDAWEVAAMAKLFGEDMHVKLMDLNNAMSASLPPFKGIAPAMFIDGIRVAAQGKQPARRFWGRFIVELGRESAQPYDLLAEQLDPATVNLDAIQTLLILQRLTADVMVREGRDKAAQMGLSWGERVARTHPSINPARCQGVAQASALQSAIWHPRRHPRLVNITDAGSSLPCTLSEIAAQLLDGSAYLSGFGFDKLLEYLGEHWGVAAIGGTGEGAAAGGGKGPSKPGSGVAAFGVTRNVVNILLAVIKLMAYYGALETSVTMSGQPPLVRTKSPYPADAAETRTITGTVRENIGKWQAFNCVRGALNAAGIDFSLPNDGPVEGAEFQWILVRGGVSVSHIAGAQSYLVSQPAVRFVGDDGTARIQSAMGVLAQNFTAPKTNKDGQALINLQGTEQRPPLKGTPVPVRKEAEVRFTVAPKPINMSQDIIDAIGTGTGGPVGNFILFPVEVLLRSNIHLSKALIVPIKDWQGCEGGWGGTITYQRSATYSQVAPGTGESTTYEVLSGEHIDASLHGDPDYGTTGLSHAEASGEKKSNELDTLHTGMGDSSIQRIDDLSGSGNVDFVIASAGQNTYTVQMVGSVPFTGQHAEIDSSSSRHYDITSGVVIPTFTATATDPNRPDLLLGSTTIPDPSDPRGTIEISWDLVMCK